MFSKLVILAALVALARAETTAAPSRCTGADGNLEPTAQSCPDEVNTCADIFKTAAVASPASRDPLCDMDAMAPVALQCSKTCAICCENPNYSCKDDPIYATTFCPNQKANCASNVTAMRDMLAQYCPATCGLCMQGSCSDSMANCAATSLMCNDANFGTMWKQQCARTCNSCPASTKPAPNTECGDTVDNCAEIASTFCNNQWYEQNYPGFIAKKCGKTCKLC
uniref:ShTK domain protein n=1 Tax=Steinernema glaseri TaxID=37863 RepID=A0A1I7YFZ0_9BILA